MKVRKKMEENAYKMKIIVSLEVHAEKTRAWNINRYVHWYRKRISSEKNNHVNTGNIKNHKK